MMEAYRMIIKQWRGTERGKTNTKNKGQNKYKKQNKNLKQLKSKWHH
jgi:hypothetical protein